MNGPSQLPQYTFDPVTQRYTMKTPAEQAREQQRGRSGLGTLYDSGGAEMGPQGPVGFGMMAPGMAEMGVGLQNIGQFQANNPVMAAFSPVTSAVTGIAGAIGNSMMGSQVSPVANPSPMTVTSIAPDPAFANPTASLAAMNAEQAAQQTEAANQNSVANTAAAVGEAVASDTGAGIGESAAAADAAASAAAGDAGGGGGGDASGGGGGGDSSSSGGGGTDTGAADGGWRGGGQIMNYEKGGLASAAQHVQDQGREGDSMLVHMSPSEVRGLQAIAMQHGGSLTINPKTGLVEANFLKSILPVVAGAALAPFTGGASMAALLVGGGTALMTGSLEKGLMAGLGAFGGASLAGALTAPAVTGTQAGLQAVGQQALGTTALPPGVTAGGGAQASALMQQNIAMGMTPAEAAAQIAGSASYAPAAAANIPASIASPTAAQMAATNAAVPRKP